MEYRESSMKKELRSLCLSNGWSYGVFWSFDLRNNMLLTMEDAYYEEEASNVVDNMLLQVHMLGEGKIGEAAFDGKHRWMFLDAMKGQVPSLQDDSEFSLQFLSEIKTVAVIPLELRGVLEFGSTKEIAETPEFLEQARKFLRDEGNLVGSNLAGNCSSSFNSDLTNQTELFASSNVSLSWENVVETIGDCWSFDSLPLPRGEFDEITGDHFGTEELIVDPNFGSLLVSDGIFEDISSNVMNTFEKQLAPSHCPSPLFDPSQMDDLFRWLDDSSSLFPTGLEAVVSKDISQAMGRDDVFSTSQCRQSASSSRSSLSYVLESCEKGKSSNAPLNYGGLLAEWGIDIECEKLGECLEPIMNPIEDNSNSLPIASHRSMTECISGIEGGNSVIGAPRKRLFSELGLGHLLRDISSSSSARSSVEDPWDPSKRRKTGTYQTMYNQKYQLTGHQNWEVNSGSMEECMPRSQVGVKVESHYSMDTKSCISSVNEQKKKTEEPIKASKKRARPGESTKPRPKDRQMIADRIKELRDLVPNGSKLSIDALLGRTVKHVLFMQNLKKHAEKLKLVIEPKLIGQENGLVDKGSSASISSSRGATWAYEVGGSNLLCPIIVEDLSHPGQMLIEMLCGEHGYFLEIIDVVRGFGLTILKGVMESRDDKIWAHFIVEGNKHITRMDVFMSLMQLLQGTLTDEETSKRSKAGTSKAVNTIPQWSNYQQYHQQMVPLPMYQI